MPLFKTYISLIGLGLENLLLDILDRFKISVLGWWDFSGILLGVVQHNTIQKLLPVQAAWPKYDSLVRKIYHT